MALLHVVSLFNGNVTTVNPTKTTCYTVPAGDRVNLRNISVRNLSGSVAMSVYVWVGGTLVHTLVCGVGGTSADSPQWDTWVIVNPGETIQLAVSAAAGVGCRISGSLYTI